jgi:hypothetical protein
MSFFIKEKARIILQGMHAIRVMHMPASVSTRIRRIASSMLALMALLSMLMVSSVAVQADTNPSALITMDGNKALSTVPSTAIGINTAAWDSNLTDAPVVGLLQNAGVKVMRFPGGSTSDAYHWQTNTIDPDGTSAGNTNFDTFMGVAQATGAQPMITVNYGSGTPAEAAAWVQYANVTKHYGIKYWEIGNELYGNGTYGADWEYDTHTQKGATAYANNALQFIQAMKAVDPSIQVGVVLTAPGDWPDGVVASGDPADWNHTVLSILGSKLDFADVHWYADFTSPGTENDQLLLENAQTAIPEKVAALRAELVQYGGNQGNTTPIFITETNSAPYNPGKQTVSTVNALFLATDYMNWLENGIKNVDWWDVFNGIVTYGNNSPSLYGTTQYGDYGVLSTGGSSGDQTEPPADTPFPAYYGLQLVNDTLGSGGTLLGATSSTSDIEVHVVRHSDWTLSVLLVNRSPTTTYNATLSALNTGTTSYATVYSYGENSTGITVQQQRGLPYQATETLAPYSITVVSFKYYIPPSN